MSDMPQKSAVPSKWPPLLVLLAFLGGVAVLVRLAGGTRKPPAAPVERATLGAGTTATSAVTSVPRPEKSSAGPGGGRRHEAPKYDPEAARKERRAVALAGPGAAFYAEVDGLDELAVPGRELAVTRILAHPAVMKFAETMQPHVEAARSSRKSTAEEIWEAFSVLRVLAPLVKNHAGMFMAGESGALTFVFELADAGEGRRRVSALLQSRQFQAQEEEIAGLRAVRYERGEQRVFLAGVERSCLISSSKDELTAALLRAAGQEEKSLAFAPDIIEAFDALPGGGAFAVVRGKLLRGLVGQHLGREALAASGVEALKTLAVRWEPQGEALVSTALLAFEKDPLGAWGALAEKPLGPGAASHIIASTPAYLAFACQPEKLLAVLDRAGPGRELRRSLEAACRLFEMDWEKDLAPELTGEVTLVMGKGFTLPGGSLPRDSVLLLGLSRPEEVRQKLRELSDKLGDRMPAREIDGRHYSLRYEAEGEKRSLSVAVVKDRLALSASALGVRRVWSTAKNKRGALVEAPEFLAARRLAGGGEAQAEFYLAVDSFGPALFRHARSLFGGDEAPFQADWSLYPAPEVFTERLIPVYTQLEKRADAVKIVSAGPLPLGIELVVGGGFYAAWARRDAQRRLVNKTTTDRLLAVGTALQKYAEKNNAFPPSPLLLVSQKLLGAEDLKNARQPAEKTPYWYVPGIKTEWPGALLLYEKDPGEDGKRLVLLHLEGAHLYTPREFTEKVTATKQLLAAVNLEWEPQLVDLSGVK